MNKLWKPALLLATVVVMAIGMLNSGAWFTDSATTQTGSITSGTLSIEDTGLTQVNLGTIENMAPGDVTGPMVITIKNNGNLDLAWFGDLIVEGDAMLKDAVYIDYAQMEFVAPSGANWQAQGTDNFISDGKGAGLYPGWYNTLAAQGVFDVISLSDFDGNNGMGVAPYEFNGALKPGYSYRLTLKFGFATEADNDYQDLSPLSIRFAAKASQIKEGALNAEKLGSWDVPFLVSWLNAQIADQTED